jgi:GT2 family glycosyltransferase
LKEADADIICLVSNDVRILKDYVIVEKTIRAKEHRILSGGKYYNVSTGWNDFDGRIFPYVEGWLLTTTKEGWKELGYFDERFAPNDFEDVDLSTTAISLGYNLGQITPDGGEILRHEGAQTISYGSPREELTKRNKEKFRQKWNLP